MNDPHIALLLRAPWKYQPEEKKKIPTSKEMAKILMAAGKDRPFLLVLFHTMGRVGEILRLRWKDVNFRSRLFGSGPGNGRGATWSSIGSP